MKHDAGHKHGPHGVKRIFKRGNSFKVAASASHTPKEVRLFLGGSP